MKINFVPKSNIDSKYHFQTKLNDISFQNSLASITSKEQVVNKKDNESTMLYKKASFLIGTIAIGYGIYRLVKGKNVETFSNESYNYISNLASDMTKALGKKIEPEQLSSVMSKEELLDVLPKLKQENYFAYMEDILPNGEYKKIFQNTNLENGIFKIDLHSHTNYSDGQANVLDLLNNVVAYANKLKEKTNEKFIFSITDHDNIDGVKEALKLIAGNPAKFENVRFVPGVELSYAHLGKNNEIVISEMLVHGINPYSSEFNEFVNKIPQARKNLFNNVISDLNNSNLGTKFDLNEVEGDFFNVKDNHDWFKYNTHWVIYNYAQIKHRLALLAHKWGVNPENKYQEIMPKWHIWANKKNPNSFENFLREQSIDFSGTSKINSEIDKICFKYFPDFKNNKIVASSERTFDDVINFFRNDKNVFLSFAHPAFTAQKVDNPKMFFNDLISQSEGLIIGTEKYHMSYFLPIKNGVITQNTVDATNNIIDEFNLYNIGGHDNHSRTLLN